jgi:TPR repeat protein
MAAEYGTRRVFGFLALGSQFLPLAGCMSLGEKVVVREEQPSDEPLVGIDPPTPLVEICELGRFRECSLRCSAGDAPSCDNLGAMYELGMTVPREPERARDLYERACKGGAGGGCTNAARMTNAMIRASSHRRVR